MNKFRHIKHILYFSVFYCLTLFMLLSFQAIGASQHVLVKGAEDLDPNVLKLGMTAYQNAQKQGLDQQGVLTIIDYSKPSYQRRLWVIDVKHNKVLYHTLVAHGKGSGGVKATCFSNSGQTHASSIGVFVTGKTYHGKHGVSLYMHGLEPQNNKAYKRHVVVHGAWYVSDKFVKQYGCVGRSWGCPALDEKVAQQVIKTIKGGTVIFSYYPDQEWLKSSEFLRRTPYTVMA
jgi:hypothetical protein